MEILNINGERINACFQFKAGNCTISVSTVFNVQRPEIVVFDEQGNMIKDGFRSIQSAIAWVDSFGPRD